MHRYRLYTHRAGMFTSLKMVEVCLVLALEKENYVGSETTPYID